jgi:hypothetical protein
VFILDGFGKTDTDLIASLADVLHRFSQFSKRERIENKIQARRVAATADWKVLIKHYIRAHNMAAGIREDN